MGLLRAQRRAHPRPGQAPAPQCPRHSARVDRCVDLSGPRWPYPGHGARRPRPQAVSLPRVVPRSVRQVQVPPHAGIQRDPAAPSRARRARPARGRPFAPPAPRHGHSPARQDPHPRGQRRIRAREPLVRIDDPAPAPRAGRRHAAALQLSRQERRRAQRGAHRPAPRAHHPALPGPAGHGNLPVPRRPESARRFLPTT